MAAFLPTLERRLKAAQAGAVRFDAFTRGRYATDASHLSDHAARRGDAAHDRRSRSGDRDLPRGGRAGDAARRRYLAGRPDCQPQRGDRLLASFSIVLVSLDVGARRCVVEPGIVLDDLNRALKSSGLWFPVDVSTASRATIGGMVGNNSCGARSLRYGNTRENVVAIDAVLADGTAPISARSTIRDADVPEALKRDLFGSRRPRGRRDRAALSESAAPRRRLQSRRHHMPGRNDINLAHLLVGSEGTLAFSTAIELKLRRCSAGAPSASAISAVSTPRWRRRSISCG